MKMLLLLEFKARKLRFYKIPINNRYITKKIELTGRRLLLIFIGKKLPMNISFYSIHLLIFAIINKWVMIVRDCVLINMISEWNHVFKLDPEKEISDEKLELLCESDTDAIIIGGTDNI